jgi:hypothetical protein
LSPGYIGRDEKLDISMSEYSQNHPPKVPLLKAASSLEQLSGGVFLARLVLAPGVLPVSASLAVFHVVMIVLHASAWNEAWKDEYGLDAQFFERAQVLLDTLRQREWQTTSSGQQGLARGRIVGQRLKIVRRIDS